MPASCRCASCTAPPSPRWRALAAPRPGSTRCRWDSPTRTTCCPPPNLPLPTLSSPDLHTVLAGAHCQGSRHAVWLLHTRNGYVYVHAAEEQASNQPGRHHAGAGRWVASRWLSPFPRVSIGNSFCVKTPLMWSFVLLLCVCVCVCR